MLTCKSVDSLLREMYPLPHRLFGLTEKEYGTNEWRMRRMIANIIVGGSRDVQAVRATEALFELYTLDDLANLDQFDYQRREIADLLELKHKIRYAGKKAEYIQHAVRAVKENFDGQLPRDVKELTSLPGVGPHAAAVLRALAFGVVDSFGVDLHVRRIAKRMGLVDEKATDKKIEKMFVEHSKVPGHLSRALVEFGQQYCRFHPSCKKCPVAKQCPQLK